MNNIRLENLKANSKRDENFFVVDEEKFNSTFLSALFIINKDKKVSKEALGLTSVLLSFSAFSNRKSSPSIRKIDLDFNEGYGKYMLRCSLLEPLSENSIRDSRLRMGKRLIKTFSSGWTSNDRDLNRAIEEITYKYSLLDADPIFQLDRMMQLNYLKDLPLGRYPYGKLEKIKKLNHLDIKLAIDHLLESNRMATYIGNTNYRFVLAARNRIKPSSKIFPLELKSPILPRGTNLEADIGNIKGNYVGFAFNLSKIHSEKNKLCHDILLSVLFDKHNGKLNDFLIENNAEVADVKLFLPAACFTVYLCSTEKLTEEFIDKFTEKIINLYKEDIEVDLFNVKRQIEKKLYRGFDNPFDMANNIYEGRISGLDYSIDVLDSKLNSIDEKDFQSYLKKINFVGSIRLKG